MKKLFLSTLCLLSFSAMAQTQLTDSELQNQYKNRTYSGRISVHDPSIVVDTFTSKTTPVYYVYGSHLGRGKTYSSHNYRSWTTFRVGEESTDANNSLFAGPSGGTVNYKNAYSLHVIKKVKNYRGEEVDFGNFDAHEWQYKDYTVQGNQWAPDVIYNKKMRKWCMYMSLNGDHWGSSIVCLTAKSPEGPWTYQGPVVFSGFQGTFEHNGFAAAEDWKHTDLEIATGETTLPQRYQVGSSWGSYWPNCIDPCVFYDDEGNLWMGYGSWSGGIFMLKLNEENGLRDYEYTYDYEVNGVKTQPGSANGRCTSDPYFGKKIAGGYYVSGEASYIEKIGKHWFLFMSYGGFAPDGGYQMRIFRADKPTGPYKDCWGTTAIYDRAVKNYDSNAGDNRGVLLMGGYQWDTMPVAEIAQGHNSAFTDKEGRSFVVYHTKFNDGSIGHQVRVHQLFLNDEGWLMAAPFEFNGEKVTNQDIATKASVADDDIPGVYQFIRHKYNQSAASKAYQKPVNIQLTADGKITGSLSGTWSRTAGTDYIHLEIGGVTYRGVLVEQSVDYTDVKTLSIAALSSSSGSLVIGQNNFTYQQEVWAVKAKPEVSIAYTKDQIVVPFTDGATINCSQTMPTKGLMGAKISWKSSDTSVMSTGGVVYKNGHVVMTLTISCGDYSYTKEYNLTVNKAAEETTPIYYPVSAQKNTTNAYNTNYSQEYTLKAGKKAQFKFYNYTAGTANFKSWVLGVSNVAHNTVGYKEYVMLRNDNWENIAVNNTGCTNNYNWDTFVQDMNGSLVDMTVEYETTGAFKMTAVITTKTKKVYNYSYTKTINEKPAKLNLFFTGENSYIDGSSIATGIEAPIIIQKKQTDGKWYNLAGQQVDKNYKGVVIVNGKKFINR